MRFNPLAPPISHEPTPVRSTTTHKTSQTLPPMPAHRPASTPGVITLETNEQKGLLELHFPGKPDDATRAKLKAAHWRWFARGKCWYNKKTDAIEAWAINFIKECSISPQGIEHVLDQRVPIQFEATPASIIPIIPMTKKQQLDAAMLDLESLRDFMGESQRRAVLDCFKGEEKEFFFDKMRELAQTVATMPKTYETEAKGDERPDPICHLHYFAGGQASWWIIEKDMGCETDEEPGQHQAFGLADLFNDGGEVGYISIAEIIANGGELDFYFTPQTLTAIRDRNNPPPPPPRPPEHITQLAPMAGMTVLGMKSAPTVPAWRQRLTERHL